MLGLEQKRSAYLDQRCIETAINIQMSGLYAQSNFTLIGPVYVFYIPYSASARFLPPVGWGFDKMGIVKPSNSVQSPKFLQRSDREVLKEIISPKCQSIEEIYVNLAFARQRDISIICAELNHHVLGD